MEKYKSPLINSNQFQKFIDSNHRFKSCSCRVRNNMKTYSSSKWLSFISQEHEEKKKQQQQNNNKNWLTKTLRKTYGSCVAFWCFTFKSKLISLSSLKPILNGEVKIMTSKKLGGLLTKAVLFINYHFLKMLNCVSLGHKDLREHLLIKIDINKLFWIHLQSNEISST